MLQEWLQGFAGVSLNGCCTYRSRDRVRVGDPVSDTTTLPCGHWWPLEAKPGEELGNSLALMRCCLTLRSRLASDDGLALGLEECSVLGDCLYGPCPSSDLAEKSWTEGCLAGRDRVDEGCGERG